MRARCWRYRGCSEQTRSFELDFCLTILFLTHHHFLGVFHLVNLSSILHLASLPPSSPISFPNVPASRLTFLASVLTSTRLKLPSAHPPELWALHSFGSQQTGSKEGKTSRAWKTRLIHAPGPPPRPSFTPLDFGTNNNNCTFSTPLPTQTWTWTTAGYHF